MYHRSMVFSIKKGARLLSLTLCLSKILTFYPLTPSLNSDVGVVKIAFWKEDRTEFFLKGNIYSPFPQYYYFLY